MPIITPIGTETRANISTNENQVGPIITPLANGQYVVVWVDYLLNGAFNLANTANADLRGRIFNADGTPAGGEFLINTTTTAAQLFHSVTTLSDGNFLVAWQDNLGTLIGGAGSPSAVIRAQEFTAAGVAVGTEFQIGSGSERYWPSIAAMPGGGIVAAWQEGTLGAYVAQVFDSSNAPVGSQFTIDNANLPAFGRILVTTLTSGNIAAIWQSGPSDPLGGATARVFTPTGTPVTDEFSIAAPNNGGFNSSIEAITSLTTGGFAFVVTVTNAALNSESGYLGAFLPDLSDWVSVDLTYGAANTIGAVSLAPLTSGGAIVSWSDSGTYGDGDGYAVNYAAFNAIGNQIGTTTRINTTATGSQSNPSVAVLSTGDIVFAWSDPSGSLGDSSGYAIHTRRYDYDPINQNPTAVNDVFMALSGFEGFPTSYLTDNDVDLDGDVLLVTSITNVQGGGITFDPVNQGFDVTYAPGSTQVTFSYTVSDGFGGTSTAQATLLQTRDDNVTLRGPANLVDFLANDALLPRPEGYTFTVSPTTIGPGVNFSVFGTNLDADLSVSTNYFINGTGYGFLPVGQTITQAVVYSVIDPTTGSTDYQAVVNITLQGWTQTGTAAFDYLVGGASADHLVGGTGTANALQGGAGDDWYTVQAAGDTVTEFAGEGNDAVYTALSSFTLPSNVENLFYTGASTSAFIGIGNDLNNIILSSPSNVSDTLIGGGGNDRLGGGAGTTGNGNTMLGGTGDDIYTVGNIEDSTIELLGEGTDTVRTTFSVYSLQANIENLTLTNTAAHLAGVGNGLDNIITGNTGRDELFGRDGNDTLIGGTGTANALYGGLGNDSYTVSAIGDSVTEFAGEGNDTVNASVASFVLGAHVENLTYTGTAAFTGIGNDLGNNLTGGTGADFLSGLDGDDTIIGGSGADILLGGLGNDVFRYNGGETGLDRILSFVSGQDRILLSTTGFSSTATIAFVSGAGATANSSNSTFLYDPTTGIVGYDADGNGSVAAVQIAQLDINTSVVASDFGFI
jgi:Ca2+-binding RTX toxin-like protein